MLAELVEQGELPPLSERLPSNPLVVEPVDQRGVYGGTWRNVITGPGETAFIWCKIGYDQLVHWETDWSRIIPNVAESFELDDSGQVYTFQLRPGMRWSDGEPFTASDIVFAVRDVWLNPDLFPVAPSWLSADGKEPPTVEAVDDHTVRFTFDRPYGLLLEHLASPSATDVTTRPRHYLQQFHAEYNPKIDELVEEEGYSDWVQLFHAKADSFDNPEMPTIWPWKLTSALGDSTDRVVAERNPFYWKTDTEGSQLPYLDDVSFDVVNDVEVVLLNITNGEYHMEFQYATKTRDKPVLARSREQGQYRFFDMIDSSSNDMGISLNLAHEDPELREVFGSRDFRIALSHAINRQEIIDIVYQKQGEPYQVAPRPESDFYDEEFAKQYTEYDIGRANQYLDDAGYAERDGDGFRLTPQGRRLVFGVDVVSDRPWWIDSLELIRQGWADVGIDMRINAIERTLFNERTSANLHDAAAWTGDAGLRDGFIFPVWYFPFSAGSRYAVPWGQWFSSNGEAGEQPPAAAQEQMELYGDVRAAADDDERNEAFREILEISKEEFYVIGTVLPQRYGIVRNDFKNLPETFYYSWMYLFTGPTRTEQYFIQG